MTLVAVLGGFGVLPGAQVASVSAAGLREDQPRHTEPDETSDGQMQLSGGSPATATPGAQPDDEVPALPADSGSGRRIVFSMADQRVWLVGESNGADAVRRSYLVSGSVTDNLQPGTYSVYSKSTQALGVDDSGTMRYMVRFARGPNAAIGFHDIPVLNGRPVQSTSDLGTPQSHGCIRQTRPDAQALWQFAPVGTKVVVVA